MEDFDEAKQRALEYLILLILGASKKPLSLLHLQKEVFLLWNFHPFVKELVSFVKHYKGPYSREVNETVLNPMFLKGYWRYIPPKRSDICGGYVELTELGWKEYERVKRNMEKNPKLVHLLAGIKMVRELYDSLSPEELLLLIYDTYPEYTQKSILYKSIFSKKKRLASNIYRCGFNR